MGGVTAGLVSFKLRMIGLKNSYRWSSVVQNSGVAIRTDVAWQMYLCT